MSQTGNASRWLVAAARDFASVRRLDAAYGATTRGTPVTENHRRWMLQLANQAGPGR